MREKLKQILPFMVVGLLGIFMFTMLAFNMIYFTTMGFIVGGVSGYDLLGLFDSFWGVMASIFQILFLIVGIGMIVYGVWGFMFVFEVSKNEPTCKKLNSVRIGEFLLFAFASLSILVMLFLIIYSIVYDYVIGWGMIFIPVILISIYFLYGLMTRKLFGENDKTLYVMVNEARRAKKANKPVKEKKEKVVKAKTVKKAKKSNLSNDSEVKEAEVIEPKNEEK